MRVLVTGSAGFIGRNLCNALKSIGHRYIAFDKRGVGGRFEDNLNIRDRRMVRAVMQGAEAVVHLAARTGVVESFDDPAKVAETNVTGTVTVLQEAVSLPHIKKFILASTAGALMTTHEFDIPNPQSPYGASKLAAEVFGRAMFRDITILRLSNVYGPWSQNKFSLIPSMMRAALEKKPLVVFGDGQQSRDFLFVDDLCDAIIKILQNDEVVSGTYNIASGKPVQVNDVIRAMRKLAHLEVEHRPARDGEVRNSVVSVAKAAERFGFNPRTSLDDGLAKTWAWFCS